MVSFGSYQKPLLSENNTTELHETFTLCLFTMASFTSLPVELISRIGEFTDPFSHLDLACTCSLIAASMKDILKRHRAEYAKMPCSDLQPLTIPRLLRDVVADPVAAHHLQTIK